MRPRLRGPGFPHGPHGAARRQSLDRPRRGRHGAQGGPRAWSTTGIRELSDHGPRRSCGCSWRGYGSAPYLGALLELVSRYGATGSGFVSPTSWSGTRSWAARSTTRASAPAIDYESDFREIADLDVRLCGSGTITGRHAPHEQRARFSCRGRRRPGPAPGTWPMCSPYAGDRAAAPAVMQEPEQSLTSRWRCTTSSSAARRSVPSSPMTCATTSTTTCWHASEVLRPEPRLAGAASERPDLLRELEEKRVRRAAPDA